jgi:16S rRNA (cytosine1402-N4)-methyltransferase
VDGTLGMGGHAWGMLHASAPDGCLLGLDLDAEAIELARQHLSVFADRIMLIQASYATLAEQLSRVGWQQVNGILIDLGLSSMQVDRAERGFSFNKPGPLDMRFDPRGSLTAADLVNDLSEDELAHIIYVYGEEIHARRIARTIVKARPFSTTQELAEVIRSAVPLGSRRSSQAGKHPATQTFQALRIAVNRELDNLQAFLPQAVSALIPGGRLAVISFHSLEDRMVKQYFKQESTDCICPPRVPVCTCQHQATLKILTAHPVRPQASEVAVNPRARSARMRAAEKV